MTRIQLPNSDKKLLEQCDVHTFRSRGKGGQHLNKTESAVRLVHQPSGISVSCQQERSQHRNKAICLAKLRRRIAGLNARPKRRIPTRMPRSVKKQIEASKIRRSQKKRLRSRIRGHED